MNYVFDYMIRSNSNYAYTNVCNIYNFIYDIIKLQETDEGKDKIYELVRKNLGMTVYNDMKAYFIRKSMI